MNYLTVNVGRDVSDILELQTQNHTSMVDEAVKETQGFVTVRHDFELLLRMNKAYPSVIARSKHALAGYALMMHRSFRPDIPVLEPMFQRLENLRWRDAPLSGEKWFIMGQVCVGETFRGKGVFDGLYRHLREVWEPHFDFVITEIAEKNPRSMRAHERVGFETLHAYANPKTGEDWRVMVWDWRM